jgi:hypothetical protein
MKVERTWDDASVWYLTIFMRQWKKDAPLPFDGSSRD